jgi:diacylglycerol kinase
MISRTQTNKCNVFNQSDCMFDKKMEQKPLDVESDDTIKLDNVYRTTKISKKIKFCLDGVKNVFEEKSLYYCLTFDSILCLTGFSLTPKNEWAIIWFACTTPILFEFVNSSVERTIDRISYKYHSLSKNAKDISAAASMLSQIVAMSTIFLSVVY